MMNHKNNKKVDWTAVVLTCQSKDNAHQFQIELETRQRKGYFPRSTLVLTVEDPKDHVGSGGATLNALLVIAEHLSAKRGFTVVNPDVLHNAHILVLHMGRDFAFDPLGRAFATLPLALKDSSKPIGLVSNLDVLIENISSMLAIDSPPGVWVGSLDLFLDIEESIKVGTEDVCAIIVPAPIDYAKCHGVFEVDKKGRLLDMIYQGSDEKLRQVSLGKDTVPVISGVMFFNTKMAEKMISFHTMPPLDACTYMGLDTGSTPIELSIFFDFMIAMCLNVTQESFVSGERSVPYGKSRRRMTPEKARLLRSARGVLWQQLHGTVAVARVIKGKHSYMNDLALVHHRHMLSNPFQSAKSYNWLNQCHAKVTGIQSEDSVVINSTVTCDIPKKTVISHSNIGSGMTIGDNCIINGVDLPNFEQTIPSNSVISSFRIRLPTMGCGGNVVTTILGLQDDVMLSISSPESTFVNIPWCEFFKRTDIKKEDLWENVSDLQNCCLLNARLFPVFHPLHPITASDVLWFATNIESNVEKWRQSWRLSLKDILMFVDVSSEFAWRRQVFSKVTEYKVEKTLSGKFDNGLGNLYISACIDGYEGQILNVLDSVAINSNDPGMAARSLANIADVLGFMVESRGGLRSGPAGNRQWAKAFNYLEKGKIPEGVMALTEERNKWIGRVDLLVRTARHYEGAAQILIRKAVETGKEFIRLSQATAPPVDTWIKATCPARIDFSGGWSDTPPISYENGGKVTNMAIKVDGKRPIGAKARRIAECKIIFRSLDKDAVEIVIDDVNQLKDYNQPHAPGALIKAALICSEILNLETPLEDQLTNGGYEIVSWSDLPRGSGLGTSSILAGAILAALWTAAGFKYTVKDIHHTILYLEQMLTTGGGWQDQVGGLCPGVKIGSTKKGFPVEIKSKQLKISERTEAELNERLLLVYTGKTRLAKNLLQNVIRNWFARNPNIVQTLQELVATAEKCAECFEKGDLAGIGECLKKYWQMKQFVAPGCTTIWINEMLEALSPLAHGMCMAGAGGGGFLYVLMIDPDMHEMVNNMLINLEVSNNFSIHL
ncbi:DgyrCDS9171 [Dimorphilus gyrociliatus]|uniref:DgyrCDS9171 n=1 Tax=Dimorphilus gyrociliatus TaxID=2664684 RepID=A0A7I8VWL9_9ANNE|nr:DgyrCDS9171 [Dimorphilus gyrociliatus]